MPVIGARRRYSERVEIGPHVFYCGDCIEVMPELPKVDCVITDPPYGVGYDGGHFHSGDWGTKRAREKLANDHDAGIYGAMFPILRRVVDGPCYVFYASSQADYVLGAARASGFDIHATIIWYKSNATYASMGANYKNCYEPILHCKPKGSTLRWCGPTNEKTVWELPRDAQNEYHPTQKPVAIIERAIRNHDVETVLDPFMGAGSGAIACHRQGKRFIGIEKNPTYFARTVNRLKDELGILFEGRQPAEVTGGRSLLKKAKS